MSVSQLKRNPFKKTPQTAQKQTYNPLKHLTDNVAGFDSQDSLADTPTDSENIADTTPSTTASHPNSENSNPYQNVAYVIFPIELVLTAPIQLLCRRNRSPPS